MDACEMLLRQLADDQAEIKAMLRQLLNARPATSAEHGLLAALHAYCGLEAFTAAQLVEDTARPITPERRELLAALRAAGGWGEVTAQRVGLLLRRLAESGLRFQGLRLDALKCEAGSRLWCLRGTRGTESL